MTQNLDASLLRGEALLHEDIITPLHHHDEAHNKLVATVCGRSRVVTPAEANRLVTTLRPNTRIDDPGVSRKHAEIRPGTPAMVPDLGSTNGIVVDGQHTTRATLRDGSRIVVGSTTIIYRQAEG